MIKHFLLCLSVFITLNAKADKGYKLTFKINGLKNDTVLLANYYGDKTYVQDTAKLDAKGVAVFTGKKDLPRGIYMFVHKRRKLFEVIVVPGENFSIETDTLDYFEKMKIKDSKENTLFYDYMKFLNSKGKLAGPIREEMQKLGKEKTTTEEYKTAQLKMKALDTEVKTYINATLTANNTTLFAHFVKANQDIDMPEAPLLANGRTDSTFGYRYYKAHYWDNIDFTDDGLIRTPVFHGKLENYIKKMTYQIPDSINVSSDIICNKAKPSKELFKYCVWYITNQYEQSQIMGMDAVFHHMVKNFYSYKQTPWIDSTTMFKITDKANKLEPILIGKKAPNVILKDFSGVVHNLYAVPNKYTVLYFFDPDCGHCQKVTPVLTAMYDSLKREGAEVFQVGSSLKAEYGKWTAFVKKLGMKGINVADPDYQSNFRYEYDLQSYPQLFVLDKDKKIVGKKLAVEQLVDFLQRLNEMEKAKLALEKKKKT
jgi:thiol-disulfide isomerase/thioredoxin